MQSGWHFAYDIFKCIFWRENFWIFILVSLKFVPQGLIDNKSTLVYSGLALNFYMYSLPGLNVLNDWFPIWCDNFVFIFSCTTLLIQLPVMLFIIWETEQQLCGSGYYLVWSGLSTYWGQDRMDTIFQTICSNAFSWMKMYEFELKFHWNLFLGVQLTIFQHWFR